ncbi:MAG: hypothetical protein ABSH22_09085 [Tepidisphaeraceae bacterium]|jgi:hypothetical protein
MKKVVNALTAVNIGSVLGMILVFRMNSAVPRSNRPVRELALLDLAFVISWVPTVLAGAYRWAKSEPKGLWKWLVGIWLLLSGLLIGWIGLNFLIFVL